MHPVFTDRSRILSYQECPRRRFLNYEFLGKGVAPKRCSIPLTTGIHTHVGLGSMLEDIVAGREPDVDKAVTLALKGYDADVAERGIQVEFLTEDAEFVRTEQRFLIEAMLRAYHKFVLPRLLEEYDVLEVEQEEQFVLVPGDKDEVDYFASPDVIFQARLDALLLEKASGDLFVMSFKTANGWDRRKENAARHDMQGLSEAAAVEKRLEKVWHSVHDEFGSLVCDPLTRYLADQPAPPKIAGIKMEHLLKGKRFENPRGSGRYVTYSPLIRAWRFRGITPSDDRYSWQYQRAKGWQEFFVWEAPEIGGVKGWIDMLERGDVEPFDENPLEAQFVLPMPYMRHTGDMERWERQTAAQEEEIPRHSSYVNDLIRQHGERSAEVANAMDVVFPIYSNSCDYPGACDYQDCLHCWGSATVQELIQDEKYMWRRPHHEPEVKAWGQEQGPEQGQEPKAA